MNNSKKQISVIMPALNEEKAIEGAVRNTLSAFQRNSIQGEVVVINDGSTDNTPKIVNSLMSEHGDVIALVNHDVPMGIGKSFWDGVQKARGEGAVMIPGDNENDPNESLCYVQLLKEVDAVVPYVVNKEVRPMFRNVVSSLFTFIINMTFRTSFKYTNGTTIFRTSVLKDIQCKNTGFFYQAETLIKVSRKGYLIAEVPCFLSRRQGGSSKAVSFSSLKKVICGYLDLIKDIYFSGQYSGNINRVESSKRVTRQS